MSFLKFKEKIECRMASERVLTDSLSLLAHGTDASFYRLIPKMIVKAESEEDITLLLSQAAKHSIPLTFRTAGTSLSGQAVTDSVLVKLGHDWKRSIIRNDGELISLQPGVIGSEANRLLKPFGRKIGPDPASIDSAMIGGIAANNASGMCCGTAQNSYKTVESMKLILADGTFLNTDDDKSVAAFRTTGAKVLEELTAVRNEILADPELHSLIKKKYKIKNTTGYSLNSFIDFGDPLDILTHLMIGSEGTLGFIAEITYRTVEDPLFKSAALVYFNDLESGCRATAELKSLPVSAVELMDESSLRSMRGKAGVPENIESGTMALLIDVRASGNCELKRRQEQVIKLLSNYGVTAEFSKTSNHYAELWKVRKGLFPLVGAQREKGTTVIIEDVCFPLTDLASGTASLKRLLDDSGYPDAVIFGHALDGNLHFVFKQNFNSTEEIQRYAVFMDKLAALVSKDFGGSLKAEHGTGRNMAPFVEIEWGTKARALMVRVKNVFDPQNILNPDVIISEKQTLHLSDLKPIPVADDLIDDCIECGFCESVCPSKDLTLSPRQRIVVWREIQQRKSVGENFREFEKSFKYSGDQTCAADGMCGTRCPVGIDTGRLIKKIRTGTAGPLVKWSAKHLGGATLMARTALRASSVSRKMIGTHKFNNYPEAAGRAKHEEIAGNREVVYFSSCVHRVIGPSKEEKDIRETVYSLFRKLNTKVIIPANLSKLCCGMAWSSKGETKLAVMKSVELQSELWGLSDEGRIPIVCDNSPCSYYMIESLRDFGLNVYDAPSYFSRLLGEFKILRKLDSVMLFPVCSVKKGGTEEDLKRIAEACALKVKTPVEIACCGFAGDRGFSHPELNESALKTLKKQSEGCGCGVSSSRTCEIGLSRHSGLKFGAILNLLDKCT